MVLSHYLYTKFRMYMGKSMERILSPRTTATQILWNGSKKLISLCLSLENVVIYCHFLNILLQFMWLWLIIYHSFLARTQNILVWHLVNGWVFAFCVSKWHSGLTAPSGPNFYPLLIGFMVYVLGFSVLFWFNGCS